MGNDRLPVLWVTGAPGAGKSTTGWGLYTRIAELGGSVAYVDIDQLGLIGPPPGGGDASHGIKADNLLQVLSVLRRRGVQQVIVSGVVDPELGAGPYLEGRDDGFDITLVRLRCDWEELRRRFLGRGSPPELLDELPELVAGLDKPIFGEALDTTGHSTEGTVGALLGRCVVRPGPVLPLETTVDGDAPVFVVTGATAVGKSTAAWGVLRELWERGVPTAYIDVGQFGFVNPGADAEVANVAAVWRGYREAGAQVLLVVTREPDSAALKALGDRLTIVGLDADAETLADRVRRRVAGESPLLAGDELRGAPAEVEHRVAERAAAEADRLRRTGAEQITLDTSGQTAEETSAALLDMLAPILGQLPAQAS